MNTPGTTEGNWHWRFHWEQVPEDIAPRIHHLLTPMTACHRAQKHSA